MYCKKCGNNLEPGAKFCPECGEAVVVERVYVEPQVVSSTTKKPHVPKCFTVFGNLGYTFGIISFICSFIPFVNLVTAELAVAGIVFSALGKRDYNNASKAQKGLTFNILGTINNPDVVSIKAGERYNIVCDEAKLTVKNATQAYLDEFTFEDGCTAELVGNTYIFYGKSAHAMQPHMGVNAIYNMFKFMNKYYPCDASSFITNYFDTNGKLLGVYINDPDMHELTINLGVCHYDGNNLLMGYNLRVPVDTHVEVIKEGFNKGLESYQSLNLGEFYYSKRHFVDPKSDLIINLLNAYQSVSGDYTNKPFTIGGGTYARTMENAVAFGPNFLDRLDICHQPDEHIYLEDFIKWIAIYAKAIYLLAK